MAYIKQVNQDEAEGVLKRVYDAAAGRVGDVANIIKVMSRDGRSVQASMQLYVSLMKSPNDLEPSHREMLAAVVSNINECYY